MRWVDYAERASKLDASAPAPGKSAPKVIKTVLISDDAGNVQWEQTTIEDSDA